MRCEVLLFAQLADALAARSLDLELPEDATVADAMDRLSAAHEIIATMRDRIAVAVDERYAVPTTVENLGSGFPPQAGANRDIRVEVEQILPVDDPELKLSLFQRLSRHTTGLSRDGGPRLLG